MVSQKTNGLLQPIQKAGCYFLSLLKIVEILSGKNYTVSEINALYQIFVNLKWLKPDCSIVKPDEITGDCLARLGINKKVFQVGVYKDGKTTFWAWVNDKQKAFEYVVIHYATTGQQGSHFVLANRERNIIYDSYGLYSYSNPIVKEVFYKVI